MNAAEWKENGKVFRHRGHNIFYRLDGTGDPVVFLHGFPTSSWDWEKVWPDLTKEFLCIAPDFIGYGYSDKPHEYNYSILDQADLVENLLRELRVERAHVFAHDYGVSIAQEMLARFQDRKRDRIKGGLEIQSVCFLNGGIFPEAHRPRLVQNLLLSPIGRWVSMFINEGIFRASFCEVFGKGTQPSDEDLKQFWELIRLNKGHEIYYRLISYIPEREKNRERWVNAVMNSRVPLRLINGVDDPVSGRHMAELYKKLIQNPDVILLAGIGHYPQYEAPEAVLRYFLEFVRRKEEEE